MSTFSVCELINTQRYPLHQPHSMAYQQLIEQGRNTLAEQGILCLPEFITPDVLTKLQSEITPLEDKTWLMHNRHTVYFTPPELSFAETHPMRQTFKTQKRSIGRHLLPSNGAINHLYQLPELRKLIAELLAKPVLYLHEDPSNAVVVNVYGENEELGWHFDRAYFTTTLLLRAAQSGGEFEYATRVRSDDDPCYEKVQAVLSENSPDIAIAPAEEGMLTIFLGHHALHRVKAIKGEIARYVLIFHFEEKPGVRLSPVHRKMFHGTDAPDD